MVGLGDRAVVETTTRVPGLVRDRRRAVWWLVGARGVVASAGPWKKGSFRGDRLYSAAMSLRIEGIEAWRWESRRCVSPVLRLRAIP